jgi:polyisoprenoid-binding protein YceI
MSSIPGYKAGTWTIDAVHSDVSFSVRHMMVSKVKGRFGKFEGTITTAEEPTASSVSVTIDLTSIDTNNEGRDAHIKSADFFEVDKHPTLTFASTAIAADGDDWKITGDLTIKGITKPVVLDTEVGGFGPDAYGGYRAGFSAKTSISRKEFGVDIEVPLDGGGVVVGDKIDITIEIEAVYQS